MNFLFISRNSPFESIGGIERYLDNLMAYYKNQINLKTRLYLMLPTEEKSYIKKEGNVTILFDNSLYLSRNILSAKKQVKTKAPDFLKRLLEIIEKYEINLICAENFHTDLPAAYSLLLNMVTMSKKIPLVLQLHSFATTELQTELVNQLKWDKISCVSKSIAGDCYNKGTDINSLLIHYLGVDTNEFKYDKKRINFLKDKLKLPINNKIILTATRIIRGRNNILREKGVITLIESFSRLSQRYPNLKLLIAVGKPPENLNEEFNMAYEKLQGYIKLHNVESNTILKTFTLHEMPDVYRGSDLFVLASENETFGQVFIEAINSGIPVIGTNVGGIPEIIRDSYNGYLIPVNNASILAQRIESLINDKLIRKNFIKVGMKVVKEKFMAEQQFQKFNKVLEDVVKEATLFSSPSEAEKCE